MQQPTKKEAPVGGIAKFFRNVTAELKKVNWPNKKELVTYTIVVIATVIIFSTIIFSWDTILTAIFKFMGFYR